MSHPSKSGVAFWRQYERYPYLLAKTLFFLLVASAVFYLLRSISNVLLPVVLAILIAYVLDPAVDWFEDQGFSRTKGIGLFLAVGALGLVLLISFLYPTIVHLIKSVGEDLSKLPSMIEKLPLSGLESWLGKDTMESLKGVLTGPTGPLSAQVPELLQGAGSTLSTAASGLLKQTTVLIGTVVNLVLIPILSFYFLRDFDDMKDEASKYLPRHQEEWMRGRLRQMDEVVGAWIRGQIEVSLILAGMYALGLALTFYLGGIEVSSGLAIGVFAGLLNIVPYLGFIVGFVLAILVALFEGTGWSPIIGVLLTFGIVQAIEGYVVTPRIVGEKVGLSPVAVIIALLLGAEILGLLGVLLAIPVVGSLRVLMPDLIAWYQRSDIFLGDAALKDAQDDATEPETPAPDTESAAPP